MQIREANINDTKGIKHLYLRAFDNLEAELVSNFAVNLLEEKSTINIISLVAIDHDAIIGHTAFSPIFLDSTNEHFGYILAPLAVLPTHQKNGIGSTIVKHGLNTISLLGVFIVFVYGDPQYYSRFGFKTDLAQDFTPPYTLRYPKGWQALKLNERGAEETSAIPIELLNSTVLPDGGQFKCVNSLYNSQLW